MSKKILDFIRKYKIEIIIYIFLILLMTFRLPYLISKDTSPIDIDDKVKVENTYTLKGKFKMTAVAELKATPITLLLAKINGWDIEKEKEDANEEKKGDMILLDSSIDNAIISAFNDKSIIKTTDFYIVYIFDKANTNLKVGDKILKVNDKKINEYSDIVDSITNSNEGDIINFEIKRGNKILNKKAIVQKYKDQLLTFLYIAPLYNIKTNPKIIEKFTDKEVGPSGGLMISLYIYSKINKIDLTKGRNIAGTGTISEQGKVGDISGVKYKLKGAVNDKADVFLVHNGMNYEEAIKEKKKKKYNIKIYGVDTLEDAINVLKKTS